MRSRIVAVLISAFLAFAGSAWAVVTISKSPVRSPFVSCRGPEAGKRIPFRAKKLPAEAFLSLLRRLGFSVVVKGDPELKRKTFTYYPEKEPTLCEVVRAFAEAMDLHAEVRRNTVSFAPYVILRYTLPFPVGKLSRSVAFSGAGTFSGAGGGAVVSAQATATGTSGTGAAGSITAVGMGSGSGASSSSSFSLTFWDELADGLALITGEKVDDKESGKGEGWFWADRATGTLFVRVRPSVARDVDAFVSTLIEKYSKVIRVRLVLYELTEDRGRHYRVSWQQAIRNFLSANWRIAGEGSRINFPPNESPWSVGYESLTSGETGPLSQGVLEVLKRYGRARIVDQAVVYLSNGYAAEIARGEHREYVSSFTQTVSEGTVSTSVEKGVIMSGVRFSVRGHVLDDESWDGPPSVFLSIFSNVVRLESLETFDTGTGSVQNPSYTGKSGFLTFVVPSGRPIVLVALDSREKRDVRSGPPLVSFLLGSRSHTRGRRTLIMLLVPEILDVTRTWGAL